MFALFVVSRHSELPNGFLSEVLSSFLKKNNFNFLLALRKFNNSAFPRALLLTLKECSDETLSIF